MIKSPRKKKKVFERYVGRLTQNQVWEILLSLFEDYEKNPAAFCQMHPRISKIIGGRSDLTKLPKIGTPISNNHIISSKTERPFQNYLTDPELDYRIKRIRENIIQKDLNNLGRSLIKLLIEDIAVVDYFEKMTNTEKELIINLLKNIAPNFKPPEILPKDIIKYNKIPNYILILNSERNLLGIQKINV